LAEIVTQNQTSSGVANGGSTGELTGYPAHRGAYENIDNVTNIPHQSVPSPIHQQPDLMENNIPHKSTY